MKIINQSSEDIRVRHSSELLKYYGQIKYSSHVKHLFRNILAYKCKTAVDLLEAFGISVRSS